jgi:hypothetical protein
MFSDAWDDAHLAISRCLPFFSFSSVPAISGMMHTLKYQGVLVLSLLFYFLRYPSNLWGSSHLKILRCAFFFFFYFHQHPSNLWDNAHLEILRCTVLSLLFYFLWCKWKWGSGWGLISVSHMSLRPLPHLHLHQRK